MPTLRRTRTTSNRSAARSPGSEDLAGKQPNDPARAAAAIVDAVSADDPLLRLPLGREVVDAIRSKLDRQREEIDAWEGLSVATAA